MSNIHSVGDAEFVETVPIDVKLFVEPLVFGHQLADLSLSSGLSFLVFFELESKMSFPFILLQYLPLLLSVVDFGVVELLREQMVAFVGMQQLLLHD